MKLIDTTTTYAIVALELHQALHALVARSRTTRSPPGSPRLSQSAHCRFNIIRNPPPLRLNALCRVVYLDGGQAEEGTAR